MVKEIHVTLYDVFGFLLPGTVFLAAVCLLFCVVFLPPLPTTYTAPDFLGWVIAVVLVYFAGHAAQSLGNITETLFRSTEEVVLAGGPGPYRLDDQVITACKAKVKESLKVETDGMGARWLYRLCDDAVLRSGKIGERDVYIYREGFYRGSAIAFAVLAAATFLLLTRLYLCLSLAMDNYYSQAFCIVLWIVAGISASAAVGLYYKSAPRSWCLWVAMAICFAAVVLALPRAIFGQQAIDIDGWERQREYLWFASIVSLAFSYLFFRRYRRFGMYRVTHAVLGFLTVKEDKKDKDTSEKKES